MINAKRLEWLHVKYYMLCLHFVESFFFRLCLFLFAQNLSTLSDLLRSNIEQWKLAETQLIDPDIHLAMVRNSNLVVYYVWKM